MSFDRLPDKLLVKIFRYLLDDEDIFDKLRETCKLFNRIVNDELLTIDDKQFPVLEPWQWDRNASYIEDYDDCGDCHEIETKARYKFRKYKRLSMFGVDSCCFKTVMNESEGLQSITELNICGSQDRANAFLINAIMRKLPNIRRLSFYVRELTNKKQPRPVDVVSRTMVCVEIDGIFDEHLFEYVLENLPAKRLKITIRKKSVASWQLSWIERYLTRHKDIVESCRVTTAKTFWPEQVTEEVMVLVNQCNELVARLGYDAMPRIDKIDEIVPEKPFEKLSRAELVEAIKFQGLPACS